MNRVVIIPCTGAKLDHRAPAAELYIGATFRPALAAARQLAGVGGRVLILSALHGLVDLDQELEPYELKMGQPSSITPADLRAQCLKRRLYGCHIITLLPNAYLETLTEAMRILPHRLTNLYAGARGIGDHRSVMRRAAAGELAVAP